MNCFSVFLLEQRTKKEVKIAVIIFCEKNESNKKVGLF